MRRAWLLLLAAVAPADPSGHVVSDNELRASWKVCDFYGHVFAPAGSNVKFVPRERTHY